MLYKDHLIIELLLVYYREELVLFSFNNKYVDSLEPSSHD